MLRRYRPDFFCLLMLPIFSAQAQNSEGPETAAVVTIFGQGQTRQVQNITRADLLEALPGANPLKTLDKLPGVSFQSADPLGAYEWSVRFGVRGFAQSQMGFTLDGIPLGDMSYSNHNGLHISRAISTENIGRVILSQGAGDVGTASSSNLGGTVQFISVPPGDSQGASASQTAGSNDTYRTFMRFDTGLLASGAKAAISASRQRAGKWKGAGSHDQDQINTRIDQSFGENKLAAFYNYSDRSETDYQDMSLEMKDRLGWDWDNYAPDWQRALNAARGVYSGAVTSMDDAYFLGRGLRKDHLAGATFDLKMGEATRLKAILYHHESQGQGHWYTPYTPSSAAVPISIRTTGYTIRRSGMVNDLTWDLGQHTLNGGFWLEHSLHGLTRNFYAVSGAEDTNRFLTGPLSTGFMQDFTSKTSQFYLQDSLMLHDGGLRLNFGFKTPKVTIDASSLAGNRAAGALTASKNILPQIGFNYDLNKNDEIFASLAKNMRAFQPGINGPFSQTQAAFNQGMDGLKPETSTSIDVGFRFHRASLQGSIAVYHADFNDRLLNVAVCSGIAGCPDMYVNVGKVQANGAELAAIWKIAPDWSWFNSATYNDSKYKTDYLDSGAIAAVRGKQVVDSPKLMVTTELAYEKNQWFVRTGAKYTDKRYYTYLNDAAVPAFWVANLSAGTRWKSIGMLQEISLMVNIENLFNARYFSTVGSNGFAASDAGGAFATLLAAAPRQIFVTLAGKL